MYSTCFGYSAPQLFKSNIEEATWILLTMLQEKDKVLLKHSLAQNLLMSADGNNIKKQLLKRTSNQCYRVLVKTKDF